MTIIAIKNLYAAYLPILDRWTALENAWDADPMNDEKEARADKYYENIYHPAYMALVNAVKTLVNCDTKTARAMIETETFKKQMYMNPMCRGCKRLGFKCNGCNCSDYTGCIYKEV